MVLVMLANFNKTADELETVTDRWLFALKDERMTTGKLKIDPFKDVLDIAKSASGSEALRQFYAELHTRNIGRDCLTEYEEKIREENDRLTRMFKTGKAEGQREAQTETVVRMRSLQMEDTRICQSLGISAQELGELMNSV